MHSHVSRSIQRQTGVLERGRGLCKYLCFIAQYRFPLHLKIILGLAIVQRRIFVTKTAIRNTRIQTEKRQRARTPLNGPNDRKPIQLPFNLYVTITLIAQRNLLLRIKIMCLHTHPNLVGLYKNNLYLRFNTFIQLAIYKILLRSASTSLPYP